MRSKVKAWPCLSLDIETDVETGEIVTVQFGTKDIQFIIAVDEVDPTPYLNLLKTRLIIGHNLKFDLLQIRKKWGISYRYVFDTMLAAQILEKNPTKKDKAGRYSLANQVQKLVDPYAYTSQGNLFRPYVTKQIRTSFKSGVELTKEQLFYAAMDVEYTHRLYLKQFPILENEDLLDVTKLENDSLLWILEIEYNGIPIDQVEWMKLNDFSRDKVNEYLTKLNTYVANPINWNSPKQVLPIFNEFGINTTVFDKKTMELKESVDSKALSKYKEVYPILEDYLSYKKWSKYASTYGEKFLSHVNPDTGRIHTSIWQIVDTGRTSSNNPNLQNIPKEKEYRTCFKAPEGRTFIVADFSNQEARIAADKSKEEGWIKAFKANRDIHLETAILMFKEDMSKEDSRRHIAKTYNFLTLFGGGAANAAERFQIPLVEARRLQSIYFESLPALKKYLDDSSIEPLKVGYLVTDDYSKRKIYLPNFEIYKFCENHIRYFRSMGWDPYQTILDEYRYLKSKYQRICQNWPIQGSGAVMSKLAGIYLLQVLQARPNLFKILHLVHDELIIECDVADAQECKLILEDCMLRASRKICRELDVPAEGKISST